jgi:hypothetical protein
MVAKEFIPLKFLFWSSIGLSVFVGGLLAAGVITTAWLVTVPFIAFLLIQGGAVVYQTRTLAKALNDGTLEASLEGAMKELRELLAEEDDEIEKPVVH